MDYLHLTAPCGLDCFNCHFYLAHENEDSLEILKQYVDQYNVPLDVMFCKGCRAHDGKIPLHKHLFGEEHYCAAWECTKEKGMDFCCDCDQFPCDNLHPYVDRAHDTPHNMKVFNLCLIKRLGLEEWAKSKAGEVRQDYFNKPWSLK